MNSRQHCSQQCKLFKTLSHHYYWFLLTKYLSDMHPDTWVQWEDSRLNSPFFREDKPSVLDMSEAVIARLQEKAGAPKDKILKVVFLSIQAYNILLSGNSLRFCQPYRRPYQGNGRYPHPSLILRQAEGNWGIWLMSLQAHPSQDGNLVLILPNCE